MLHVSQQSLRIHDNPVSNGVLDAFHLDGLSAGRLASYAGAVHDFDVVEWIGGEDDEIGQVTGTKSAELSVPERDGADFRGGVEGFERAEACMLQQLDFTNGAKAPEVVDEADVGTDCDLAAAIFIILQEIHPTPVHLGPVRFVAGSPVIEVGGVTFRIGLPGVHHAGQSELIVPG